MKLAVLGGAGVAMADGRLYTHGSFGRVIEELAFRHRKVVLAVRGLPLRTVNEDYLLPGNVTLIPLPAAPTALRGMLGSRSVARAYREAIAHADRVFVRGVLVPAVDAIYAECARQNTPVCHWLVGNPMGLLQSHRRDGWLKDTAGKLFVANWERQLHRGHQRARAAYLCNGREIAERHPSAHSYITVSSTLREEDFFWRDDTCSSDPVRVLCLCFIRPEKGVEYLIEAFAHLRTGRKTELVLSGSRDRYPRYQAKLNELVEAYKIGERVTWTGQIAPHEVAEQMRAADVFAFPSLSEGTPRVLVEARANALPLVTTSVGGIPSSVTDGWDGLLVPAKDPQAMARGIERLIADSELRRLLIANGFERAKRMTIPRFVDEVIQAFEGLEGIQGHGLPGGGIEP